MKQYPSIPSGIIKNKSFFCFQKIDGSNIRVEWTKKNGLYKFGTRRRLLDETDLQFPDAPSLVIEGLTETSADSESTPVDADEIVNAG